MYIHILYLFGIYVFICLLFLHGFRMVPNLRAHTKVLQARTRVCKALHVDPLLRLDPFFEVRFMYLQEAIWVFECHSFFSDGLDVGV